MLVLSDNFGDAWVQVDGTAEVLDVPEAAAAASLELIVYYLDLVNARRARREDDLTSALVHADVEGESLTDEEIGPDADDPALTLEAWRARIERVGERGSTCDPPAHARAA